MNLTYIPQKTFRGKKILIMGLGRLGGGEGLARFFVEERALVTVTDLKGEMELKEPLTKLKDLSIKYVLGRHRPEDFKNQDLVIRNPDVPRDSEFLKIARANGIPVEMDVSLFLRLCPLPLVGVTGTRGKTTTTALIGEILKSAGCHTLLGGNIPGMATLSLLRQITPQTKVVLELSSWQLQGLSEDRLSPHVAVVTNIYPDHMNRYSSFEEYIDDKKLIFKYQSKEDFLILNQEDKIVRNFASQTKSKILWFSKNDWPKNWPLKIMGEHNLENAAASYVVGKLFQIEEKIIQKAVENFPGLPHRLEIARKLHGVTYVNDSASTMPQAGIAALHTFRGHPIILLAGGNSKSLNLSEFVQEIVKWVKAVVLLEGTATNELEAGLKAQGAGERILGRFDNFQKAIFTASSIAKPGDVILLSPACTSFGMFQNEFDRGERFKKIVNVLN